RTSSDDGDMVTASGKDWTFGFTRTGNATGRPAHAQGNTIRYDEALPNTDLSYAAAPDGLKEQIVLNAPPNGNGPVRFTFPLRLDHAMASDSANGVAIS